MSFTIYLICVSSITICLIAYVIKESIQQDGSEHTLKIDMDSGKQVDGMRKFMKTELFRQLMQLNGKEI